MPSDHTEALEFLKPLVPKIFCSQRQLDRLANTVPSLKKNKIATDSENDQWFYGLSPIDFRKALRRLFLSEHLTIAIMKFGLTISMLLSPLLLDALTTNFGSTRGSLPQETPISRATSWLTGGSNPKIIGLFISLLLIINLGLGLFFDSQYRWKVNKCCSQVKICFQAYVYAKFLKLREAPDRKIANPLNIITSDIDTMNTFVFNFHQSWSSILRLVYAVAMLWIRVIHNLLTRFLSIFIIR